MTKDKGAGAKQFWENLSKDPEAKQKWLMERSKKIEAGKANKVGARVLSEIGVDLPLVIDHSYTMRLLGQMAKDPDIQPNERAIVTLHGYVRNLGSIERVRMNHFPDIPVLVFDKLKKAYIAFLGSNSEDISLSLITNKVEVINTIKSQITNLIEKQKDYPKLFAKEIIAGAKAIAEIDTDFVKALDSLNSIGVKDKGLQINIINKIPRPMHSNMRDESTSPHANKKWREKKERLTAEMDKHVLTIENDLT